MRVWIESRFPPSAVAIDEAPGGPAGVEPSPVTNGWQSPRGWPHISGSSAAGASADEVLADHAARRSSRGARGGSPTGSATPPAVRKKVVVPQDTKDQGYGTIGRPVELLCNHFPVKLTNMTDVYQYHVTITPEVPKKVNRDVMNKLRTTAAEFKRKRGAYDGDKILFTSGPLNVNNEAQEYPVFLDDERKSSFKLQDSPLQQGSQVATSFPPTGSPAKQGMVQKERQTVWRVREFVVHIKFAVKVNMRVFGDAISEQPGAQVYRAEDAL